MNHQRSMKSRRLLTSPATTTNASTAASLADDLVFDVLARLPVKSVCRFRCVSTGWEALISDPAFVAAHGSWHAEPLLVVSSKGDNYDMFDLQLMDLDGNIVRTAKVTGAPTRLISSSTDDLVCFTDHSGGARVIDPSTGLVLADCAVVKSSRNVLMPYHSFTLGFGRAVTSGVYKVVRLMNGRSCEVFTLGDPAGWRWSPFPETNGPFALSMSVSLDGIMYFLLLPFGHETSTLICLDIEKEEWKKDIQGPPQVLASWKRSLLVRITDLNGALCMLDFECSGYYEHVNIWLLKDSHKNTWTKAYTISMAPFTYEYSPLRVIPGANKLVVYCSNRKQGGLLQLYDPYTKAYTTLRRFDYNADKLCLCSLHLDRFLPVKNFCPQ